LATSFRIKAFALAATIKGCACAINARSMDTQEGPPKMGEGLTYDGCPKIH
jgi:hypothetical protein